MSEATVSSASDRACSSPHVSGDRAPTDFRYWANLDKRGPRLLRSVGRTLLRFDPAPPDHLVRAFASSYYDADPIAEAFVREVTVRDGAELGSKPARDLLARALRDGVDAIPEAPVSLRALFDDVAEDPPWLHWALVELGAKVFRRYGTHVFSFAGAITLEGYGESSVAKPLALTGAYAGSSARRRFLETASFWIDVSEPGGMRPGAPGWIAAMRVRIMHVFVRDRLRGHPEWDLEAWGEPISQGDALLTLMGGSFAPGFAMQAMGYRPSLHEIEAMMHFWRYVGHLMGVRPRWFPADLREAAQLSFVALVKAAHRSGEDGDRLCQSYVDAFAPDPRAPWRERLRDAWWHRLHVGYTRFFLPSRSYRAHRLPPAGLWGLHPLVQFPFIFAAETLRRTIPPLEEVADRRARRGRRRWLEAHSGRRAAEFRPVERFTR